MFVNSVVTYIRTGWGECNNLRMKITQIVEVNVLKTQITCKLYCTNIFELKT